MTQVEETAGGTTVAEPPEGPTHEATSPPAEPEAPPREKREYVVLVKESPTLIGDAATALTELLASKVDDGDPDSPKLAALVETLAGAGGVQLWGELGRVTAFNRAGALEEVERLWPASLEGKNVALHLIPARFWSEITPEEAPPPPPRRRWSGV